MKFLTIIAFRCDRQIVFGQFAYRCYILQLLFTNMPINKLIGTPQKIRWLAQTRTPG